MQRPRHDDRGSTLAGILIVLSILVMLSMAMRPQLHSGDEARVMKAQTDVDILAAAVRRFAGANGRVPSLEELTEPDARGEITIVELCEDPWGNAYEIEGMTVTSFGVISAGPDGELDTGDDIRSCRGADR